MARLYEVSRPVRGRVAIKMPFAKNNRAKLHAMLGERIQPEWDGQAKRWMVARSHFDAIVEALAEKLGRIDVFIHFTSTERCDTNCRGAKHRECNCQCLGRHHGPDGMTHGWKLVGDSTLVLSSEERVRHIVVVHQN